jgi:hypothetical protein
MEVKIGVIHASRELTIDTALDAAEVEEQVRTALTAGGVLALADATGRIFLIAGVIALLTFVTIALMPVTELRTTIR